jgi:predicted RNase H-like HicB family nuclease
MATKKVPGPDGKQYDAEVDRYVAMAMRKATPERTESNKWYCALSPFPGVWAEGDSVKECLDTLEEVLREWLILKIVDGDNDMPVVDDIDLSVVSRRFRS